LANSSLWYACAWPELIGFDRVIIASFEKRRLLVHRCWLLRLLQLPLPGAYRHLSPIRAR
jgi:hypothetical protein